MAIQWPLLRREGWRYQPRIDWRDPGLREVLMQMAPGTLGLAAVQVNVFINTILATGQGTGAVSWLNYAFRLMYLPIGLFGISIGTAALPEISRLAAAADVAALRRTIAGALRLMLVLNVPATDRTRRARAPHRIAAARARAVRPRRYRRHRRSACLLRPRPASAIQRSRLRRPVFMRCATAARRSSSA